MKIKIGFTEAEAGRITEAELAAAGLECVLVPAVQTPLNALKLGEIQILADRLEKLPVTPEEGIVTTAVSARNHPADVLWISPDAYATQEILKLPKRARLGCFSLIQQAQFQEIRPDVDIQVLETDITTALEQLQQGNLDAILAPEVALSGLELPHLKTLALSPLEFVPAPGQGVVGWQSLAADIPTRQVFQTVHHSEVSACTNVERKVLKLLGESFKGQLGVYCERDANGFYHAVAACVVQGELGKARVSSSTNFGLAESLVRQLT